jgi:gliding motility-associated-like protein
VAFSVIDNIEESGYQVIVRDLDDVTAPVDTFTTWVFRNIFRIDEVRVIDNDCDGLRLDIHTTPEFHFFYTVYHFQRFLDPPHRGETRINQVSSVQWTPMRIACKNNAGGNATIFPGVNDADLTWQTRNRWFAYISAPPPLCDAEYKLEITDVFGKSATYTTPVINAKAAKAIPTIQEKSMTDFWQDAGEQPRGEALYELRFQHDNSVNAGEYQWKGFANAQQINGDRTVVWTETTADRNADVFPRMPHRSTYTAGYTPGSYQVRLIVRNDHGCVDSVSVRHIVVEPSSFDAQAVPNAFTPNNDGQNDFFIFVKGQEPVSMEYIYVHIYNRSGGLVYRYEGRCDAWQGWDGRMMGTGSDVTEGVYYYVISGRGWDDVNYNSKEYSGYLHLFR